jgi:hypothetical protein
MRQAELAWVKSLMDDLRTGALAWNSEQIITAVASAAKKS